MGRKRTLATAKLPTRMLARRQKSGRVYYYYADPRAKRDIALGSDLSVALSKYRLIATPSRNRAPLPAECAKLLFRSMLRNAKTKSIPVSLTLQDVGEMLTAADGRCAVTGLSFHSTHAPGKRVRPWMPSIDRIVPGGPYSPENTRLVCVAVNLAMNQFGEDAFYQIAVATTLKHRIFAERTLLNAEQS